MDWNNRRKGKTARSAEQWGRNWDNRVILW
jgi:hypothetical protein